MRRILLLFSKVLLLTAVIGTTGCSVLKGIRNNEIWHHDDQLREEDYPALPHKDKKALKTVKELAQRIKPDLILTTGDNTSWKFDHNLTPRLIQVFEDLGIPWAVTLGNHDAEGRGDRYWKLFRYGYARRNSDYPTKQQQRYQYRACL